MQPSVTGLLSESDSAEPSQHLPSHLNDWFQRPVRGPRNLCTLEITLTGSSTFTTDLATTVDEFFRRTLRDTDLVLAINPRLRLALLRCFPDDLPSLMKRLGTAWRQQAETCPQGQLLDLVFQPGACLEPSENQAEQLAALLQLYHHRDSHAPTLS
jgi:hypothetical protein